MQVVRHATWIHLLVTVFRVNSRFLTADATNEFVADMNFCAALPVPAGALVVFGTDSRVTLQNQFSAGTEISVFWSSEWRENLKR